jgi:hypothetical protein
MLHHMRMGQSVVQLLRTLLTLRGTLITLFLELHHLLGHNLSQINPLNIETTSVRNKVFFGARFYYTLRQV